MFMANSDRLRKKRGALRTGVTRALAQLMDLLQETNPDLSEGSVQLDYLKDEGSALSILDDAVLAGTDEDNLDREVETAQDYSDKVSGALVRAKYQLEGRHQATRTHAQASGSESSNIDLPNSVDAPDQAIWDHYDATIHQNNKLPRIEKFKYLLTYLTGSANGSLKPSDDLEIMYWRKIKEIDHATSATETPEDRMRRANDLLTFLRIQVEVREEGRLQPRRRPYESEDGMALECTDQPRAYRLLLNPLRSEDPPRQVFEPGNYQKHSHRMYECVAADKPYMGRVRKPTTSRLSPSRQRATTTCLDRSKAFPSETRIIKLTTPSPAAGSWKRVGRLASMSTLVLAMRVVVIGGSMVVTPDLRDFSQTGYFLCDHHDEDRVFEILHAKYITIKHVNDTLHPIKSVPRTGRGATSANERAAVRQLQKPARGHFDYTAQKKHMKCNRSIDDDVYGMKNNLAQVNDLHFVPYYKPVEISGEDASMVPPENSHKTSKLLVSTLGLEEGCMENLQRSLPKVTDLWIWQVLPNMNCEIRMNTNVVSVYENNGDVVAEKPMDFSYVRPSRFINDLDLLGIMIADGPPKPSPYRWLSWESIRLQRHLESESNELRHSIPSNFLLGSRNISLLLHGCASGLPNAFVVQRNARHTGASKGWYELPT
ncbi:hypothetical protein HPB52_023547 [Rhipicephalus sanguineus]|uniref:Uncharacterized protein n=1 Tax=Rhipicephalus sanguineus TaxID=34632 RepID=A0A9D4SR87_RHISA|nr:hypothetical protein HPB52_023547 [Rhipicephalus sanguineus]